MPNTKEKGKLIEVLSKHIPYGYATLGLIAEELMADGVRLEEKRATSDGCITKAVMEKLVELLITSDDYENSVCLGYPCKVCQYKGVDCTYKARADHLIKHGVTVQEWISVKDRLPDKDGHYLCNYHFGEYPKMTFTQVLDYYATDIVPHFQHTLGDGSMKVTHWMEIPQLPQPPKGE